MVFDGAGVEIAGTLALPDGAGPFPAVYLISGSGAQDRDAEMFGHKRHAVLADRLVRAGVAVLRTDDRGVGGSSGDLSLALYADLVGDAMAGVRFLQDLEQVDRDRVGLYGASQGSVVTLLAAADNREVAFCVLASAVGTPGAELFVAQHRRRAEASGLPEPTVKQIAELAGRIVEIVRSDRLSIDTKRRRLTVAVEHLERLAATSPLSPRALGLGSSEKLVDSALTPAMKDLLELDPRPALRRLHQPVLATWAELDLQVDPDTNLAVIAESLEMAGNRDHQMVVLPGLNHFMQPARTGLPSEYADSEVAYSPVFLDLVAEWITSRFGPSRR